MVPTYLHTNIFSLLNGIVLTYVFNVKYCCFVRCPPDFCARPAPSCMTQIFGPPALMGIGTTKPYGDVSRAMKREAAVTRGLVCCSVAGAALWLVGRTGLLAKAAHKLN